MKLTLSTTWFSRFPLAFVLALQLSGIVRAADESLAPDPQRVAEIAAMLPEKPVGLGQPIQNRDIWDQLAKAEELSFLRKAFRRRLEEPIPKVTEEIYRRIVVSGSRPEWYALDHNRYTRFRGYVMAECMENKGRFLPRIEQALATFFSENTWFIPLYQKRSIANFEGRKNEIDLYKAMNSWELALTDWLLGDKLKAETRRQLRENIERRTLAPFRRMIRREQKQDWWLKTTNNWNAVCLSGVVGAALILVEDREDRAFFIASAEKYSKNFLRGFTADGYCTEGLGYWNFGFGQYLSLVEAVYQSTDGKLDLLQVPNIRNIAQFGTRCEIMNGVYPAIADCPPGSKPAARIQYYVNRRLDLGLEPWNQTSVRGGMAGKLYEKLISLFPNSADAIPPRAVENYTLEPRSFFDVMGILVCRPGKSKARLAACLKGGHNAEHHNHNDVGSFVVVVGNETPIMDIGAEVYTHQTFSKDRYKSEALSSYGHSTPVVAGQFQSAGRASSAKVLRTEFSDSRDSFVLDLKSAYPVPELETLRRTFTYSREGDGELRVCDEVEFAEAQTFETALLTAGGVKILPGNSLLVYTELEALRVEVEAEGAPIVLRSSPLNADLRKKTVATRVAIAFSEPVQQGKITLRIVPGKHPLIDDSVLLQNGGFEQGQAYWTIKERIPMGSISDTRAASGKYSLHIIDESTEAGSSVLSKVMRMEAGKRYEISAAYFGVSGEKLGLVTRFFDRADRMLDLPDDEIRLAGTIMLSGDGKQWKNFRKSFTAPENCHYARVWVHSFNSAKAEGYLDDIRVRERDAVSEEK